MKRNDHPEAGFSLVEMAVALVITGILIAGVLKGTELIESARLNRLVAQIQQYRIAATSFWERYGALPGDFSKASIVIDRRLQDGEGKGRLSGQGLQKGSSALNFWSHLVVAGLLTPPGKPEDLGVGEFGKGAPTTDLGGGVTVETNPEKGLQGHWFIVGNAAGSSSKGALFTPQQAMRIMSKIDSTQPLAGTVQARDGVDVPAASCVTSKGELNIQHEQSACVLYFQI